MFVGREGTSKMLCAVDYIFNFICAFNWLQPMKKNRIFHCVQSHWSVTNKAECLWGREWYLNAILNYTFFYHWSSVSCLFACLSFFSQLTLADCVKARTTALTKLAEFHIVPTFIPLHGKFLQSDWLRAAVFQFNLKYLHVKIRTLLRVVV